VVVSAVKDRPACLSSCEGLTESGRILRVLVFVVRGACVFTVSNLFASLFIIYKTEHPHAVSACGCFFGGLVSSGLRSVYVQERELQDGFDQWEMDGGGPQGGQVRVVSDFFLILFVVDVWLTPSFFSSFVLRTWVCR
jgi:hypothetical protein